MKKSNLVVHKFGGSCLIDQASIESIKKILPEKNEIIVVSAIKGVTNRLQALLDLAKANSDYSAEIQSLQELHANLTQAEKFKREQHFHDYLLVKVILAKEKFIPCSATYSQPLLLNYLFPVVEAYLIFP